MNALSKVAWRARWGVVLGIFSCAACRQESSSEVSHRESPVAEARPASEARRAASPGDGGTSTPPPKSVDATVKLVSSPPIPKGYRRLEVSLETEGRALYVPEDRSVPSALLAQGFDDTLRVEKVEDFTRFLHVRNEPEALQFIRLLETLQGVLPGLDCFDPVKTPGEQLTEKRHPLLTLTAEHAELDLKLYRPPVQKVDRSRIRLSREAPRGPFRVENYLVCGTPGRVRRLVFVRETVGPHGEYHRQETEVLAQGNFD